MKRGPGAGGPYELWANGKKVGRERHDFSTVRFLPSFLNINNSLVSSADIWLRRLRRFLTEIRAIGPFRQQPARRYEFRGQPPEAPDMSGENAIDALIDDETRRGGGQLLKELNRWLKALAKVQVLPLKNISKTARLYEIRLKDLETGRWANFADVGSGVGQALPIMVEGLRTRPGGLFIVQEPESHLHPDAQLAIADFLVYLTQTGRAVLVETHSELILLRMRRRYLERRRTRHRIPEISGLVVGEGTRVRHMLVDEMAHVKNWPPGFLEDASEERLTLLEEMALVAEQTK